MSHHDPHGTVSISKLSLKPFLPFLTLDRSGLPVLLHPLIPTSFAKRTCPQALERCIAKAAIQVETPVVYSIVSAGQPVALVQRIFIGTRFKLESTTLST